MIVTIVRFAPRTEGQYTIDEARQAFAETAATYLERSGLLWKAYLLADDGRSVGGVYWWTDRGSAEATFNDDWIAGVTAKYGAPPSIEWFDTPVVVDTRFSAIRTGAPPADVLQAEVDGHHETA